MCIVCHGISPTTSWTAQVKLCFLHGACSPVASGFSSRPLTSIFQVFIWCLLLLTRRWQARQPGPDCCLVVGILAKHIMTSDTLTMWGNLYHTRANEIRHTSGSSNPRYTDIITWEEASVVCTFFNYLQRKGKFLNQTLHRQNDMANIVKTVSNWTLRNAALSHATSRGLCNQEWPQHVHCCQALMIPPTGPPSKAPQQSHPQPERELSTTMWKVIKTGGGGGDSPQHKSINRIRTIP